ncbi:MAG: hypothetical protein QOE09_1914 [Ilumatobacteraceae bacterium]|jgi:hypothetical protein
MRGLAIWLFAGRSLVACDGTLQFSAVPETGNSPVLPRDAADDVHAGDASVDQVGIGDVALGDMSVSDRPSGFAPPCYKDTDCPVNKLHCDLPTNQCVECLADINCTVEPFLKCLKNVHRCVECATEKDCAAGSICHPVTRVCLSGCADAGRCPALQPYCDARGFCVECRTNADCAQVDVCDTTIGRCAFCNDDRSCVAPVSYCDPYNPGRNRCKECLDPSQCPVDRPYCDVHGRDCVAKP